MDSVLRLLALRELRTLHVRTLVVEKLGINLLTTNVNSLLRITSYSESACPITPIQNFKLRFWDNLRLHSILSYPSNGQTDRQQLGFSNIHTTYTYTITGRI